MIGTAGVLIVAMGVGAGWTGTEAVRAADPTADTVQAIELEQEAQALFPQPHRWRRAASLLERAAALRDASDPVRTQNLVMAGQIHGHLRNAARAERLLTQAAEEAHARGALLDAARSYLAAADYAIQRAEHRRAAALVDRAELLASSPYLSGVEQAAIRARLPEARRG